ncbi:hypothetical protein Y032_0008g230 [Ancylostoma ceylanicum]|uniref:Uncharacterized protein n=1 Tax=Ancylostoma ceylanicum TaxID=53326 RepID=A0A016VKC0_9BILA|nr:hypothetical protein Y032_0008g230 [Ancylostoma ceylanicum]
MQSISLLLLLLVVVDICYCTLHPCTTPECQQTLEEVLQMEYKPKRNYDFVRFGRSSPAKKASYDYIRFGKRSDSRAAAYGGARYALVQL